jgi:hypothetical protein
MSNKKEELKIALSPKAYGYLRQVTASKLIILRL